jgi:hemolysin activation/secretion protein
LTRDWKDERVEDSFTWALRGTAQFSDGPLLPSEELGVGGYASVRGYEERLVNGDDGWIINNELRTPSFKIGNLLGKYGYGDGLQFLAFVDYGAVRANGVRTDLLSVGPGLRYRMSRNVFVRFDYGFQLLERNLSTRNSRAHIGVLLSF